MTTLAPKSQKASGFLSPQHDVELIRKRTVRTAGDYEGPRNE